ncbi:phosphoglucomutase/phosphomannomutase, alpha/beta/alpha domain I family protein, partial [Chlamydia psittaci 84-8471/1]
PGSCLLHFKNRTRFGWSHDYSFS